MFKIGEFAQIGRVSGRQLRHYDQLDLLRPSHTDPQTGYRYYSARQLPRLNRILALKALGFSLEHIGRLLDEEVATEELRGMLAMRKAQIELSLGEEQARLRQIEARILQIEEQGILRDYDVVLRNEPSRPFLSVRQLCDAMPDAIGFLQLVVKEGTRQLGSALRGRFAVIAHSDFENEALDLEAGFLLARPTNKTVTLPGDLRSSYRELEPVDEMAALVRHGPADRTHLAYGALGIWMEANGYRIAGLCREVFLEMPFTDPDKDDVVMEIQFPVSSMA